MADPHGAVPWLDPRRWSAFVRAQALYLAIATVVEYGLVWSTLFDRWVGTERDARDIGVSLGLLHSSVLILPLVASQVVVGLWLILFARVRPLREPRALGLAEASLAAVGLARKGYRAPILCVGRVGEPHAASLLGRTYIVLPTNSIALYSHLMGPAEGDQAFQAIVAHEAGHLASADDLLFTPWFAYMCSLFILCVVGCLGVARGALPWTLMANHMIAFALLIPVGLYGMRRREAYADSLAVVALRAVNPIRAALRILAMGTASPWPSWTATHFDARRRAEWVAGAGWPFLALSRWDLRLLALIYYPLADLSPFSLLALGDGIVSELATWAGDMTQFLMLVLFILTVAGATLARRGKAIRLLDAGMVVALCVLAKQLRVMLEQEAFRMNVLDWVKLFGEALWACFLFVVVNRVLTRWTVAVVRRPGRDVQQRLVSSAVFLAALFTVPFAFSGALFQRLMRLIPIQAFLAGSDPRFLWLGLAMAGVMAVMAVIALAVVVWSVIRSWRPVPQPCDTCGKPDAPSARERLPITCSHCRGVLNSAMFVTVDT